jgi:hypothetical protein
MPFKRHQSTFDEMLSASIGLVIGLIFVASGFVVRHKMEYERTALIETPGTVVDSVSRRDRSNNEDKETYAPIIEFQVNGDPARFTGRYESYRWSNGRVVTVRFDPQHPSTTAQVVDPLEGLVPWWMFGMGGFLTASSLVSLLPVRWSWRKAEDKGGRG